MQDARTFGTAGRLRVQGPYPIPPASMLSWREATRPPLRFLWHGPLFQVFSGTIFNQISVDNPITTLVHYPCKEVRLAFRETPLTIQI